ncbi:MAG: methionyl-tRNA formyltransferase [Pikeienuella sp.]
MRIAFMGTPEFSVPTLIALSEAGHEIVAVYTQPPRRAGRGKKERPTPVAVAADALGLSVRTPKNFKEQNDRDAFAALNLEAAVVVAYGLILPTDVLEAPSHGCFNLHASLLPRWRGAAPIQRAIMAGDSETGVCVMQMELGLDTGPVALIARTAIKDDDTTASLHDRLSELGAPLMVSALTKLQAGTLSFEAQPETGLYAPKIDKAEAHIDWSQPAEQVDRLIRGVSPSPGAWFTYKGQRIKVLNCKIATGCGYPGVTANDRLTIYCGEDAIELTRVQPAGKGPMAAEDFLRGSSVEAGETLN